MTGETQRNSELARLIGLEAVERPLMGGLQLPKRAIEHTFPTIELSRIAERESTGFGRRHYRPVYLMHKWWARRLGSVFRALVLYSLLEPTEDDCSADSLWKLYSRDIDLSDKIVFDPMMGGGTTVVEALRFDCRVIGGDINPVAWFVVKKQIEDIEPNLLKTALSRLEAELGKELRMYYHTSCPECGEDAEGIYYFHCMEAQCPDCGSIVALMRDHVLAKSITGRGSTVVCPQCWEVFDAPTVRELVVCPNCAKAFVPKTTSSVKGGVFKCSRCSGEHRLSGFYQHRAHGSRMYAVEFYCKVCHDRGNPRLKNGRGYKKPDDRDLALLSLAEEEYRRVEAELPLPETMIPVGIETRRALNYGYQRFRDMFSPRQLLNLGKINKWIMRCEDWHLKEFLLLAFSNCLKYNNLFCKYNGTRGFITDIFRTHSFSPSVSPVEANCYDTARGRGAFTAFVRLLIEGKEYCRRPFDRLPSESGLKQVWSQRPISADMVDSFISLSRRRRVMLQCASSEHVNIPESSVDAVVTDPPYESNVMYSELSNFFYVWLRLSLRSRYPWFADDVVPWEREVISNRVQNKGHREYLDGLTQVFRECHRVLKSEGVMTFTFHHMNPRSWGSVLRALLNAGFVVSCVWPVKSEMDASTHLRGLNSMHYDSVVVCRKRTEHGTEADWGELMDEVREVSEMQLQTLKLQGLRFSASDALVVVLGNSLRIYSSHYPNVVNQGVPVDTEEALCTVARLAQTEWRSGLLLEGEK